VVAWLLGGIAILALAGWQKRARKRASRGADITRMSIRMALFIGLAQCIAMWPGVSRSLATILGGMLAGLSMPAAVEFSFLLGMLTLGAATAFDALKHGQEMLQAFSISSLSVGLIVAFISAVFSVKWMVGYLNKHGLEIFGYYRIGLALVVGALILAKVL
jgi:undecaprenyl-diphosphatase